MVGEARQGRRVPLRGVEKVGGSGNPQKTGSPRWVIAAAGPSSFTVLRLPSRTCPPVWKHTSVVRSFPRSAPYEYAAAAAAVPAAHDGSMRARWKVYLLYRRLNQVCETF